MKGELVVLETVEDDFKVERYRLIILCNAKPPFKLGDIEVKQK